MSADIRVPMSRLERRARLLLRAYPPQYRADRGEEILGTLLEASAEGARRPGLRDSWSILAGGIRARGDRNRAAGLAASLRLAVIVGMALYLAKVAGSWLDSANLRAHLVIVRAPTGSWSQYAHGLHWSPLVLWYSLGAIALLAANVGAWAGLRFLTIPAAFAAIVLQAWALSGGPSSVLAAISSHAFDLAVLTSLLPVVASLVVLVVLTRRTGRPPLTWLALPALPVVLFAVQQVVTGGKAGFQLMFELPTAATVNAESLSVVALLAGIAALAWAITDTRPALGVGLFLAVTELAPLGTTLQTERNMRWSLPALWHHSGPEFGAFFVGLALTSAMTLLLARRTGPRATIH